MFKRRGFTDKLYFMNLKFVWGFTIACLIINVIALFLCVTEIPIITYGLPLAWGELALHTKLIIDKAVSENRRKFRLGSNEFQESEDNLWNG